MKAIILLLLAGAVWWWTGPSSDELIVYPATCANGIIVLPLSIVTAQTRSIEQAFKKHKTDRENCRIFPRRETVYKLNKARGEVYYLSDAGSRRLVKCSIFSRTEWSCSFPDDSGKIVMIDGLRAIRMENDADITQSSSFSLRRWQWWAVTLWFWIDGSPQGGWLIPEQHEYN